MVASGDLYVQVAVREHKIFTRDGRDLYCEVPISFLLTRPWVGSLGCLRWMVG